MAASLFREYNNNTSKIVLQRCKFGSGCARQLSMALRGCNLESLELFEMNVALATLLRHTSTELQELHIHNSGIDNEGVEALVGALTSNSRLSNCLYP